MFHTTASPHKHDRLSAPSFSFAIFSIFPQSPLLSPTNACISPCLSHSHARHPVLHACHMVLLRRMSLHTSWPTGGLHVVGCDSPSPDLPTGLGTLHGPLVGLHVVGFPSCTLHGPYAGYMLSALTVLCLRLSSLHTSWPIGGLHVVGFDWHFRCP
jgi:hypothetical protein